MSDFITIAEAKAQQKGSFVGVVVKIGDLKSGTTDKGDWTLKVYTIEDKSGQIEFLAWDDAERKLLQLGHTYEFHSPWYKKKDDNVSIQKSNYGKIVHKEVEVKPIEPTAAEPTQEEEIKPLPEAGANMIDKIAQNTVLLMQIEKIVRETVGEFEHGNVNDQRVGLYVKLNFEDIKRTVPKS